MLGILCGLESEAALARRIAGAKVACAAARPEKARMLARELLRNGATRLMSFGIAGGLAPDLPIGSLVIGTHVANLNGKWMCDTAWGETLARRVPQARQGGVWGSEFLVPTADEKSAIHEESQCVIVDMESQGAAEVAAEGGVPLMVVRAVCDTAAMNVPPVVMAAIKEDGNVNVPKAIGHILRHPSEIQALFHVGRGTASALKALKIHLGDIG